MKAGRHKIVQAVGSAFRYRLNVVKRCAKADELLSTICALDSASLKNSQSIPGDIVIFDFTDRIDWFCGYMLGLPLPNEFYASRDFFRKKSEIGCTFPIRVTVFSNCTFLFQAAEGFLDYPVEKHLAMPAP